VLASGWLVYLAFRGRRVAAEPAATLPTGGPPAAIAPAQPAANAAD
jgi:hypothetical protein